MKIIDRREPIKASLMFFLAFVALCEGVLLFGGRWILVSERRWQADNSAIVGPVVTPSTKSWEVLDCKYWTGRSTQEIEYNSEFFPIPKECPFIAVAS
ncbi:hypothetical protein [Sphingobium aquiterrae]|uniref:hypothetical protein n=1 Tax=Sphingobium aquiterrae TaxID=2038656 RepID=UPI00301816CB